MQPRLRTGIAHWLDNSQIDRERAAVVVTGQPAGEHEQWSQDVEIAHRDEDFVAYAIADLERRRQIEEEFLATFRIDTDTGVSHLDPPSTRASDGLPGHRACAMTLGVARTT